MHEGFLPERASALMRLILRCMRACSSLRLLLRDPEELLADWALRDDAGGADIYSIEVLILTFQLDKMPFFFRSLWRPNMTQL